MIRTLCLLAAILAPAAALAQGGHHAEWSRLNGSLVTVNGQAGGCDVTANGARFVGLPRGDIVMTAFNGGPRPVRVEWRAELTGAGAPRVVTLAPLVLPARTAVGLIPVMGDMQGPLAGTRLTVTLTACAPQ